MKIYRLIVNTKSLYYFLIYITLLYIHKQTTTKWKWKLFTHRERARHTDIYTTLNGTNVWIGNIL